jgi:hypothetical protein
MRLWASIAARQNDQRTSDKVIAFFAVLNTSDFRENQSEHPQDWFGAGDDHERRAGGG